MKQSTKRKNKTKAIAKQLAKNVAAAGAGTAVGYFGGGLLTKKVLQSPRFRRDLLSLSPSQQARVIRGVNTAGGLAGMTAAGLSSIAIHNALNNHTDKTAEFFIRYAEKSLV